MTTEWNTSGRGDNTSHHLLEIAAPREAVFAAVTTIGGLSSWWTTSVNADQPPAIGALYTFTFRGAFAPRMRIIELDPPHLVVWQGLGGHAAWGGETQIRFALAATSDGGTLVRFWHQLGAERSEDGVASANFNWGYYLDSLRLYCETGTGKPFQTEVAGARVAASEIG